MVAAAGPAPVAQLLPEPPGSRLDPSVAARATAPLRLGWTSTSCGDGDKVVHRCAVPRAAFRLSEQRAWFVECLPDHVLLIQQGGFWEVVAHRPAARRGRSPDGHADPNRWPRRLARRRLATFTSTLWGSGLPVAWIEETCRRLTDIAERALVLRWSGAGHAAGAGVADEVGQAALAFTDPRVRGPSLCLCAPSSAVPDRHHRQRRRRSWASPLAPRLDATHPCRRAALAATRSGGEPRMPGWLC